jgi:hypothetical protein
VTRRLQKRKFVIIDIATNNDKLCQNLRYHTGLENALTQLNLPSKSKENFEGLVTDFVLIRHKLIHFSESRSTSHFQIAMNSELAVINSYLRIACMKLLREKVTQP